MLAGHFEALSCRRLPKLTYSGDHMEQRRRVHTVRTLMLSMGRLPLVMGFLLIHAGLVSGVTVPVTVPANVGPWTQSLNPSFDYTWAHDNAAPIVIDASSGVGFYPSGTLTVMYVSGLVSPGGAGGYGWWDANGQVGNVTNTYDTNSPDGRFPAYYMNPLVDVNSVALVGTFANNGVIVGTPFLIGNGPTTLTIPASANQLLLGINDRYFSDNEGAFNVTVSSPFNVCLLYDATKPAKSGSTISMKIQLCTAAGDNLSSSGILVHATGVTQTSNLITGPAEDAGNANPDSDFRYDAALGGTGGYIYNLKTTGLTTGTYRLNFTIFGEAYGVPFQVK
jgi:hypothetical protein